MITEVTLPKGYVYFIHKAFKIKGVSGCIYSSRFFWADRTTNTIYSKFHSKPLDSVSGFIL
ncbi:hypothetical protein [uncultured Helicobacter sp.]|uniref:hypothetical protein n=1 Tax=uncultured Helicobacter sp. TaxID=175537 RepID=UPI003751DCB5